MAALIAGKKYKLRKGDTAQIAPGVEHSLVFPYPVKYLNFTSPGYFATLVETNGVPYEKEPSNTSGIKKAGNIGETSDRDQ